MICSRKSREGVYEGYPNHVESLKRVVFKETVEPCRWRSETRNLNPGLKQMMKITTASLRGGWCPRHPGTSTIDSQLQDGACTDGWKNLANQP